MSFLSLVTLTFDRDLQTRPSDGPTTSSVQRFPRYFTYKLEMWSNAQRDGRPAEYMWRPLFNAAKFG